MSRLARLTLIAYPKAFRREFGPDYLQAVADLHAHGQRGPLHIAGRLIGDAVTTAPTMRWENLMTSSKLITTTVAAVAAIALLIVGGPFVAIPLLAVGTWLTLGARRRNQPIAKEAADKGQRWYVWLAVAAALFAIGGTMLFTADDGDLNTAAWAIWVLSWLSAGIVAVVGLGLGATRLAHQRQI